MQPCLSNEQALANAAETEAGMYLVPRLLSGDSLAGTTDSGEALEKLAAREISAQELTAAACKRIDEVEGTIKAFVTLTKEQALAAAQVDASFSR